MVVREYEEVLEGQYSLTISRSHFRAHFFLIDDARKLIQLIWIYTHEEFKKRPPDKDLKGIMQELLDAESESE